MKKYEKTIHALLVFGFLFYIGFLLWIVLFKVVSPLELFSSHRFYYRALNLIPFRGVFYGSINKLDLFGNIILFIPLGIYLNLSDKPPKLLNNILTIILMSLVLETTQYIFSIGGTDVTDVICNSIGGFIGLGLFALLRRLLKDPLRIKTVVTGCSTLMIFFLCFLLTALYIYN